MITVKEYLDADKKENTDIVKEYNKELIKEYPFLLPKNVWTGKLDQDYDYKFTWMDSMPDGWRIAFGDKMLKELRGELIKHKYEKDEFDESGTTPIELEIQNNGFEDTWLNHYFLMQIKEKFGSLRWYTGGAPQEVHDIIYKYENLSEKICIKCGEPAKYISKGWICPWCSKCAHDNFERDKKFYRLNTAKFENEYSTVEEWFSKDDEI